MSINQTFSKDESKRVKRLKQRGMSIHQTFSQDLFCARHSVGLWDSEMNE